MPVILPWGLAIFIGTAQAQAAPQGDSNAELAKKLSTPIASLISVPPDTTNLSVNTESTYDWQARRLTMPFNLNAGHLFHLGGQAINLAAGVRYTATARAGEAQWGGRFTLFPQ
jgi:hypothetical protein